MYIFFYLFFHFFLGNCKTYSQNKSDSQNGQQTKSSQNYFQKNTPQKNTPVQIYVENTGSMDGYFRGNTDFKNMLAEILPDINYHYDSVSYNFINSNVYPSRTQDIKAFIKSLEPTSPNYNQGNRHYSDINEIINQMLINANTNGISLLVSDCIYGSSTGNNAPVLSSEKAITKTNFLAQLKQTPDLSISVIRFLSSFSGNYYYYDQSSRKYKIQKISPSDGKRPYFLWIIGKADVLEGFIKKVPIKKSLPGYKNAFKIINRKQEALGDISFSVLKETGKQGSFDQDGRGLLITSIEDIDLSRREKSFEMTIAVNLNGIQANSRFISKTSNYRLSKGWKIVSVQPIGNSTVENSRDRQRIKAIKATHSIRVKIVDLKQATEEDKFTLRLLTPSKYGVPLWDRYSTEDGQRLAEAIRVNNKKLIASEIQKTLGISHFVNGVYEAYNTVRRSVRRSEKRPKNYFRISIPVTFD